MSTGEAMREMLEEENLERPDVVRLARALSVAARVEPALLRRVRTRLFPEMDPGIESDLWFSSLIESAGHGGFVLDPQVAEVLRRSLAEDHRAHAGPPGSSLLDRMEAIIGEVHAGRLPSIWAEEQATIVALRGGPEQAIEEALRPAVKAMLESDERGLEVARWALRALPRLPEAARRTEAATMLALGASARLGGRPVAAPPDADGASLSPHLAWALPREKLAERTELSVRLLRGGIEFLAVDTELPVVSLPKTHPLLVQISWSAPGEPGQKLAQVQPGKVLHLPETVSQVTLRTLAGDEYDLRIVGEGGGADLALAPEYAWAADALVHVEDGHVSTTGWIPVPGRVVTVASAFPEDVPYLHVIWRDHHVPARVVARDDDADLLLLEPTEPLPGDARPLPLVSSSQGIDFSESLAVLGLASNGPISVGIQRSAALESQSESKSIARLVEFTTPGGVPVPVAEAMAGGPVLAGDRVVGYVRGFGPPLSDVQAGERVHRTMVRDVHPVHLLLAAAEAPAESQKQASPEDRAFVVVLDCTTGNRGRQARRKELAGRLAEMSTLEFRITDPLDRALQLDIPEVTAETWHLLGGAVGAVLICDAGTFDHPVAEWVARAVAWRRVVSGGLFTAVQVLFDAGVPERAHDEPWSHLGGTLVLRPNDPLRTSVLGDLVGKRSVLSTAPVDPAVFLLATRLRAFPASLLASVAASDIWGSHSPAATDEFPEFEVAVRMVRNGPGGSIAALRELRGFAGDPAVMGGILRVVASTLVPTSMVNALRRAAGRPPGQRIALFDAELPHTAEMLVSRVGHFGEWWSVTLLDPNHPSPDYLVEMIEHTLRGNADREINNLEHREGRLVAIITRRLQGPNRDLAGIRNRLPAVVMLILGDEARPLGDARMDVEPEVIPPPGREMEQEWHRAYTTALATIDDGLSGDVMA